MRLMVLGSGSSGNALYIEAGATGVVVDVGLSAKETSRRLVEAGVDPKQLSGIVVTHEHADHVRGVRVFSKTTRVPVFISEPTRQACAFPRDGEGMHWGEVISSSQGFAIGELEFLPFSVPHDSVDTFAYTVQAGGVKCGIVTDLGYITQLVSERMKGCDFVMIEANHDRDMLKVGPYPWPVKQRIASNTGHLSNDEAARWLREDFDGQARHVVLGHLSRQCNHPELVRLSAIQAVTARGTEFCPEAAGRISVAHPELPSGWFNL